MHRRRVLKLGASKPEPERDEVEMGAPQTVTKQRALARAEARKLDGSPWSATSTIVVESTYIIGAEDDGVIRAHAFDVQVQDSSLTP